MEKLLFITKNFMPEIGGGLRRIEALYNLFISRNDVKVDVITAVNIDRSKYENVEYVKQSFFKDSAKKSMGFDSSKTRIKLIDKALLGWVPNVIKKILFKKYDYVYVSTPTFSNIVAGILYKKIRFNKPKIILEYRDFFSYNPSFIDNFAKKIIRGLENFILKNCFKIVVTTSFMKSRLEEIVKSENIFLIRNYISKSDVDAVSSLDKIKFPDSFYNIGYIGKLNTGRNPDKIIELLEKKINNKPIALHFVGINEIQKVRIIDIANEKKFDTSRLFFEGTVDRIKSLQYMKSFDALMLIVNNDALISQGYGIPGKLYDYIAINNNIVSDLETFKNIESELECRVIEEIDEFVNYKIQDNENLDKIFNIFLNKILR